MRTIPARISVRLACAASVVAPHKTPTTELTASRSRSTARGTRSRAARRRHAGSQRARSPAPTDDRARAVRESLGDAEQEADGEADRRRRLDTEINAFVLDMKDEFGLNYKTQNPEFAKNAGHGEHGERRRAARHAQGAQHSPDRAHRRLQGLGHGARASRVDDSQDRRLGLARQEGHRLGEPVSPRAVGLQHRRRRRAGEDGVRRSAVRLHPISRAVSEPAEAGLSGLEERVQARRARRVSQGSKDAPQQARRALDGGHLRPRHDGERTRSKSGRQWEKHLAATSTSCCRWCTRRTTRTASWASTVRTPSRTR